MMRTTKLVLLMLGVVAFTLCVVAPPKAWAERATSGVQEGQQVPAIIAQARFANHIKGLQWMGMANKGEWGNPDVRPIFLPELEYPGGSGTVFLFSGGLWVGAVKNGVPIVSASLRWRTRWGPRTRRVARRARGPSRPSVGRRTGLRCPGVCAAGCGVHEAPLCAPPHALGGRRPRSGSNMRPSRGSPCFTRPTS